MTLVAYIDCAKLVDDAGFPAGTSQATGIAIIAAESGRDPNAKHVNVDGSIDRGLWEINSVFHVEVTDAQAYDPAQATAAAFKISNGGTDYSPWSTFKNGAYMAHMEAAKVALDGWARVKALNKTVAGLNAQISPLQNQISTLQSELSSDQQQIADLVTKDGLLQSQLTSSQADLAAAQTKLANEVTLATKLQSAIQSAQQVLAASLSS